jgi:hypothetical protein
LEAILYIVMTAILVIGSYLLWRFYPLLISAAAMTFLAIYWVAKHQDLFGLAFAFILGGFAIYTGYEAVRALHSNQ